MSLPRKKTSSSSLPYNNKQTYDEGEETDEQEDEHDFKNMSLKERGDKIGSIIAKSQYYINREQLLLNRAKNFITVREDDESIGEAEDDLTEVMPLDEYDQHMQQLSLMSTTLRPNNKHKSVQHLVDINNKLLLLMDKFQNQDAKSYTWEKKYESLQKVHSRLVRKHRLQVKMLKSKILSLTGNLSSKHASDDIKAFFASLNSITGDIVDENSELKVLNYHGGESTKQKRKKNGLKKSSLDDDETSLIFTTENQLKSTKGIAGKFKAVPLDDIMEIQFPSMPMKKRPAASVGSNYNSSSSSSKKAKV